MSGTVLSLWRGHIPRRELMADILVEVSKKRGVTVRSLLSKHRYQPLASVRQEVMWEVRTRTPLSLPEIGRRLGGRDHTTVLFGIRAHERRMAEGQA